MKDIYRNPILYYILVPAVVVLWPLLTWAINLPAADKGLEDQLAQNKKAKAAMVDILTLDPDRSGMPILMMSVRNLLMIVQWQ